MEAVGGRDPLESAGAGTGTGTKEVSGPSRGQIHRPASLKDHLPTPVPQPQHHVTEDLFVRNFFYP